MGIQTTALAIKPIVKTMSLNASAARAFEHFTRNIHLWWPLATHSISLAAAKSVVFEAKEGGRLYEIDEEARKREWGRVLVCEAPIVSSSRGCWKRLKRRPKSRSGSERPTPPSA